jgi:predicted nucleic-acid-binding protein
MRSLDTNVLARFFVEDPDDEQAARQRPAAVAALSERAYVTVTVLLEFEWVMRGFYELSPIKVAVVMRALAGIEHVTIEDRDAVLASIESLEGGLDFADALHLQRSHRASSFATFDRTLARRAAKRSAHGAPKIELLY